VHQPAARDPDRRDHARPAPAVDALGHDVQHCRTGNHGERERREREYRKGAGSGITVQLPHEPEALQREEGIDPLDHGAVGRDELGEAARSYAESSFDISAIADRFEEVFPDGARSDPR